MLRSLYVMLDYRIAAVDGEIGRVQDFLFDDESWLIQYMVVETGNLGGGERVLILPFSLGFPDWESKRFSVTLTLDQLLTSPPIEANMPVSMQYKAGRKSPGSHLRSMREVFGYRIHAIDGEIGSVEDFIVDDTLWTVHHIVVSLTERPATSILMAPEAVRSISWRGKAAWVNWPLCDVTASPVFDPASPVNKGEADSPRDYYGRPVVT